MNYLYDFDGAVYSPDGRVSVNPSDVSRINREMERAELEWLKSGPKSVVLYTEGGGISTWLGTVIDAHPRVGPRVLCNGFARGRSGLNKRRHVSCTLFGHRYSGWAYENGTYVKLRRRK